MAKPKTAAPPREEALSADDPSVQLAKYLERTKTEHFNFVEDTVYTVSSGSLNLDSEIGGFGPALVRLVGPPSAGKSSFSLNVMREFFRAVPNSRGVYVRTEGKFSEEIKARSGLSYTTKADDWKDGTCFVFESNIYEVIIGLMRDLIMNNPERRVYMFILDSMDGLNLRNDMAKVLGDDNQRVAGAPLLTKQFLQKIAVAMTKYGHLCFFLSQVSAEIKLDPYAKGAGRQIGGAGGNAVQHFASHVLSFQEWYEGDLILENPDARVDRIKNRPLGHTCKVRITKTDKEKRHITVEIPIKHGVIAGSAVWREREIADQLMGFGLVTKKGSWLSLTEPLKKELADKEFADVPEQVQGYNQLCDLLTARCDITDYLFERFKVLNAGVAAA